MLYCKTWMFEILKTMLEFCWYVLVLSETNKPYPDIVQQQSFTSCSYSNHVIRLAPDDGSVLIDIFSLISTCWVKSILKINLLLSILFSKYG